MLSRQVLPFAVAFATSALAGPSDGWAHERADGTTLVVALTVDHDLPETTSETLAREVEAIWRAQGVHVVWSPPNDISAALRVFVVENSALLGGVHGPELKLGRLLRPDAGSPMAIVSVAASARVADRARDRQLPRVSPLEDRRLGLVLGRAVAHEIGHYLLDSPLHARRGLMRSAITAQEFGDLRSGSLALDPTDGLWPRVGLRVSID